MIYFCEFIDCCTNKERNGLALPEAGLWKLRRIRRGFEKVNVPRAWERC
jgi:hypothetical protein